MCEKSENLLICLNIDDSTIYKFNEKINEKTIIDSAKFIEKLLKGNDAKPAKVQNIFELMIEVMQNMLNYSYGNVELEDNKIEATGAFVLSYNSKDDTYKMQSCNLIAKGQEDIIKTKLDSIKGLDDKELRKLMRTKMRSKEDAHDKGAGLGFIMMARKCTKPIETEFIPYDEESLQFKSVLVI